MSKPHPDTIRAYLDKLDLSDQKARLLKDKGRLWCWWHDLRVIERDYKHFLFLIATNPGKMFEPASNAMDELWHTHILFTKFYQKVCEDLLGKGRFIHHTPFTPSMPRDVVMKAA